MTLRTLMLAGSAEAADLFTRLADTTDTAVKTRERLFAELKIGLEQHVDLEERHLFPILRKQPDTKDLVAAAIRDNKDLRGKLAELEALPKNDETFLGKVSDLQKTFRQHARDDKRELLPAVQAALSEEQLQGVVEKMETSLADAEQVRLDQAEQKRAAARQEREEREQAEAQAQQEQDAKQERQAAARRAKEAAREAAEAEARVADLAAQAAAKRTRDAAHAVTVAAPRVTKRAVEAVERTAAVASAPQKTGVFFWDMMLGLSAAQPGRAAVTLEAGPSVPTSQRAPANEEVIPLAEEVLVVGKRTVNTGTTRIRRYVVETPVEQQVSLVRERVVVERRRPATNKVTGEALTELTVEIVETDEVPVIAKSVQLREEVVIRTERTEHVETVRDTVRQDEVEIEQANTRQPARARS